MEQQQMPEDGATSGGTTTNSAAPRASEMEWEQRSDGERVRVLRDAGSGQHWRVWVADTRHVPGARAERCLIYDSGTCLRRVWSVPDDWAGMPVAALLALADRPLAGVATSVASRARPTADAPLGAP